MKNLLLSMLLMAGTPSLLAEPLASDVYQVGLTAREKGMFLTLCIQDHCQKSLSYNQVPDGYQYDFGTFPIPDSGNVELRIFRYFPEQRRVTRPPEYRVDGACSVDSCGHYSFIGADGPVTSTTDMCEVGLATHCDRQHPGKYGNMRKWGY